MELQREAPERERDAARGSPQTDASPRGDRQQRSRQSLSGGLHSVGRGPAAAALFQPERPGPERSGQQARTPASGRRGPAHSPGCPAGVNRPNRTAHAPSGLPSIPLRDSETRIRAAGHCLILLRDIPTSRTAVGIVPTSPTHGTKPSERRRRAAGADPGCMCSTPQGRSPQSGPRSESVTEVGSPQRE